LEGLDDFVNLSELDLSGNKISDPEEIVKLARAVPTLKKLDLRQNPLKDQEEICLRLFPSLTQLNGKPVASLKKNGQNKTKDIVCELPVKKVQDIRRNRSIDKPKDQEILKEIKKLQAENTELKAHNSKLVEELAHKSRLIITKSKDLTKNNERLVELEQELAMCKLESISAQNTGAVKNELNSARNKIAGKELESEIETMKRQYVELEVKVEECEMRLKILSDEKDKLDSMQKEYYWKVLQGKDVHKRKCERKEQLKKLLASSEYFRKRFITLQHEIAELKNTIREQFNIDKEQKLKELEIKYEEVIEGLEKATIKMKRLDYYSVKSEGSLELDTELKYYSNKSTELTQSNLRSFQEEENTIDQKIRYNISIII
jgi:chromosome segregation ATPase